MINRPGLKQWRSGRGQAGISIIETAAALAILGILAVAFLGGLGTSFKAATVINEQAVAENLVSGEIEYIKNCDYQYSATEYPVDPDLDIPPGFVVPPPVVEPVHATDDGVQKVTVTVTRNGKVMLTVHTYKVDRL